MEVIPSPGAAAMCGGKSTSRFDGDVLDEHRRRRSSGLPRATTKNGEGLLRDHGFGIDPHRERPAGDARRRWGASSGRPAGHVLCNATIRSNDYLLLVNQGRVGRTTTLPG